jgi:glycosyltransferase involved in cell wall biosynthesis
MSLKEERNSSISMGAMGSRGHAALRSSVKYPDKTCRLLYLVGQLRLGGLERQLYYLLANLDHARYKPAAVVWNLNPTDKYYWDIKGLKIPLYGFPPDWSPLSKLLAFRALARQLAPEVIHSYGFHTNFAAYYGAWGTRTLAIGSLRSDIAYAKAKGGMIRGALNSRWPSYHISNSSACAEAASRNGYLFGPKYFSVVRNGLDLNCFRVSNDPSGLRNYVAAVGSLFPVKRWDRLLRIVQKVMSVVGGDVRFRIAGDGPLRPTLEKLAKDLGVVQVVDFQGAIQDVAAFLKGAKFLVHTSESEGCPNVVMEAMACGLPVVAMEAGDIRYLVEEGKTGFVVCQEDETTFVERVFQLLGDDELCHKMGLAARKKAEQEFGLGRFVEEALGAYRAAGWQG